MNEFRLAWRGLRRSPVVAAIAVLSLALGIGACTAIFSVANAVILRSLPVEKPDELVLLRYVSKKGNIFDSFGYSEYAALRDAPAVLSGMAALASAEANLASDEATERVRAQVVSGNYFPLLGVQARIGRLMGTEDPNSVCVIGYGLWQRRFGSSPGVIGRRIQINGRPYSILGVTAEGFTGTDQGVEAQIYLPLMAAPEVFSRPVDNKLQPPFLKWPDWLRLVARRQPGMTPARVQAVLDARFEQLELAHRDSTFESSNRRGEPGRRARLLVADGRQGFDNLRFRYERPLLVLLFLVGLLLAIACVNVANLLLARAAGRRKEIAIRIALGSGPWTLLRQLSAESLLLAVGGAGCGWLLSMWIKDLLLRVTFVTGDRALDVQPDLTVAGFLLGTSFLTTLLFGLAPALATLRTSVGAALKNEGAGGGKRRALGGALVVAQVTLSVTLLAGAGLLLRSLHNLQSIQRGFRAENVLLASLNPGANHYSAEQARNLFTSLMERAESIPGVQAVGAAMVSPLSGSLWLYSLEVPGYQAAPGQIPLAYFNAIGPGYFASVGVRLKRGREFTRLDRAGAPLVGMVNETMAKKFWAGRDPMGQRFKSGAFDDREVEVVGVVQDSIYRDLREKIEPVLYVPLLQSDTRSATLTLRVSGDPARAFNELRNAARQIDRSVPLYGLQTLEAQIAGTLSPERMLALVSTLFGGLAMLLAMVGLYGVLANSVAQRAREIGIRMALGAARGQVVAGVLRQALRMVAAGLVLGIPISLAVSRWIATMLYGLGPGDAATYGAIVVVLLGAALVATLVPSRRAAGVDPMVVLRWE